MSWYHNRLVNDWGLISIYAAIYMVLPRVWNNPSVPLSIFSTVDISIVRYNLFKSPKNSVVINTSGFFYRMWYRITIYFYIKYNIYIFIHLFIYLFIYLYRNIYIYMYENEQINIYIYIYIFVFYLRPAGSNIITPALQLVPSPVCRTSPTRAILGGAEQRWPFWMGKISSLWENPWGKSWNNAKNMGNMAQMRKWNMRGSCYNAHGKVLRYEEAWWTMAKRRCHVVTAESK